MTNPWGLPPRQVECMKLLVGLGKGCNKLIARELGIDHRTVETHVYRALRRMGVENRVQAAVMWDRWERAQ